MESKEWKVTKRGISIPQESLRGRSHLCPDLNCDVIWTDYSRLSFDKGCSHFCFGKPKTDIAGLVFKERETEHVNDICKCIYTPLKGMIRYFTNFEDLWIEVLGSMVVMDVVQPLKCDICEKIVKRRLQSIVVLPDGKKRCSECIPKNDK